MKKNFLFLLYSGWKIFKIPLFLFFGIFPWGCRFNPSCSVYTFNAIKKCGIIKGCFLGLKRIIKCQPYYLVKKKDKNFI